MKFTINLLIFCAWFLSPQFALAEASLNFLYTPGSTVFTRMDSADAYSAINFHNGIEDIYFRVGAPKGIASGGVLTITPVPAAPESVAIEDARLDWNMFLTKEDMYVNLEEYIDSSKLLLRAFRMVPELIPVSIVLLSIFFLSIFSCCCLVMIAMKLVKRQTNEYVKKILGASAFLTCALFSYIGFSSAFSPYIDGGMVRTGPPPQFFQQDTSNNVSEVRLLKVFHGNNHYDIDLFLAQNQFPQLPLGEADISRLAHDGWSFAVTYTSFSQEPHSYLRYVHIAFPTQRPFFPLSVNYKLDSTPLPIIISLFVPVVASEKAQEVLYQSHDCASCFPLRYDSVVKINQPQELYTQDIVLDEGLPIGLKIYQYFSYELTVFLGLILFVLGYLFTRLRSKTQRILIIVSLVFSVVALMLAVMHGYTQSMI